MTKTFFNVRPVAIFFALFVLLAVFLPTGFAHAAIVQVQKVRGKTSGASTTVSATWGSATTAGNLLVAIIGLRNSSAITPPTVTGNSWTLADRGNRTNSSNAIYYIKNANSQSGASTWTITSSQATLHLVEYSGADTVGPLDVHTNNSGTTSPTSSGTTATTNLASEVAVSGVNDSAGAASAGNEFTISSSGWTEEAETGSSGGPQSSRTDGAFDQKILAATGTQLATNTYSNSINWASSIATFKSVPTAPGIPDMTAATDTGASNTDNITSNTTPAFAISCVTGDTVTLFDNITSVGSGVCAAGTVTITSSALSEGVHTSMNAKQDGSAASGNLSITIDTTAPVISSVAPATNASITNITTSSAVGYTLSEPVASGTIVMTRTSGTADGSSPHTCTLVGTALNIGSHAALDMSNTTNSCAVAQSLVSGTVYTFAWNVIDTAGNTATQVSSTGVTFDSRITPTLSVTNSPVTYNGSSQAAAVSGSVPGVVSNVKYNGSATVPTNVATYAITADFVPTDTTTYKSLTGASAGNFVITKGTPTLNVTNSPVAYNGSSQAATVSGSVAGSVSNIKYNGSATTPTNAATYTVTADFAPTDSTNYNSLTGSSAGNFIIGVASQTITFNSLSNKSLGDPDFSVSATVSSGLTISFASQTAGVCTVNIATVHIVTTGTCTIRASQSGNSNYNAAPNVDQSFNIIQAATKFVIVPPTNGTVDNPIVVTVQAEKSDNSVDTNYQTGVTLHTTGSATGAGLVTIVNGVGTLNISDTISETITLSLTDSQSTGLNVSSTQPLTFSPGAVASYSLNDVVSVVAGNRAAYTVTHKDQHGNLVTSGSSIVYLYSTSAGVNKKFYDAATNGNVITSITIVDGQSAANFWYYDEAPGTYTITASDNSSAPDGNTGIHDGTDSISVLPSPLALFVLSGDATLAAGNRSSFTVTRKDNLGGLYTTGSTVVYLYSTSVGVNKKFYDAATNGNIITSINITNGNSTANFWYYDEAPGTYTITASDNSSAPDGNAGVADGTSSLAVTAGSVAQFILNDPGNMYAKTRLGYTVTRKDLFGNLVTLGSTTAYLYTTSTSSTEKFYNDPLAGSVITSVSIASGHSSANFWYYDETAGTYTITASDNSSAPDGATGVADGTDSVVVNPVAVKFVILSATNITVDAPATITVQAQKPDNSVDTNYQSSVTLNTTGLATGSGVVTILNGVGTKNVSDTVAETITLSLSDSQSTGLDVSSTQPVVFAGGAIAQFSLSHPGTLSAGSRAQYTVTRKDQYNNLTSTGPVTVYLYSTSTSLNKKFYDAASAGSIITSIIIPDGQSSINFWYYDEKPGTYSITASDNSSAPDGNTGINDAIDSIVVTAGPVAQFILNDPGDMTAGTRLGYTVSRKDLFGNLVTSSDTTVFLYSSSGSATASFFNASTGGSSVNSIAITNGSSSSNFWYYDETPGNYTITASDNSSAPDGVTGIADGTDSVLVNAAPIVATRFVILNPGNGTVDNPVTVTIQAQDNSGSLDTTYQNGVTLNTTGSANGGGLVTIVNGVGTMNISDTAAETVSLSLTDSQTTGLNVSSTQNIIFSTGVVSQFSLNHPGDMVAGTRLGYTVTRKDQFGNLITSGLTTIYLYGLPSGTNEKFYDSAGGGSVIAFVNIPDGNSSAQFWYYDEKAEASSVVVSDNATAPDGNAGIDDVSDSVKVSAGPVAKFTLNNPGNMFASTRLEYTVSRQDQFGNQVTSGVTLVHPYTSSTGANAKFYDGATAGLVINTIPIDDGNVSVNFWYFDDTAGTWVITASDNGSAPDGATGIIDAADSVTVSLVPIVATRFVILSSGASQINVPLTVTVKAEDANGNVDTTYQTGVTLVAGGSATGGGLVNIVNGVGTMSINDTKSEIVPLSLADTQSAGLDVSSTDQINFSALPPVFVASASGVTPLVNVGRISFSGRAYPGADLSIIAVKGTEPVIKKGTVSSTDGTFNITFTGLSPGAGAYALLVKDKDSRTAQSKVYDLNLLSADSILEVNNILVSPTIGFPRPTITKGDFLAVVGYATPLSKLSIEVDDKPVIADITAGSDGSYKYLYNTALLDLGSHTIRILQTTPDGVQSEFSPQKIFFTTDLTVPKTDFNNDGRINIQDWSIFLARWFSTDPATRLLDDLNGDGKVDATDLSIFVRTLRQ